MLDISCNVFFVWYCVVNLDGISCVYENVVCELVCRCVGLVYVSYVFQVWCIGRWCTDASVVPVWWEGCVVQVLLGALGEVCRWWAGWYKKMCYEYHVKIFQLTSNYVTRKIKTKWKRNYIYIFLSSLFCFWIFHYTSYQPISVFNFGWSISHLETLIAPRLQNLRFLFLNFAWSWGWM